MRHDTFSQDHDKLTTKFIGTKIIEMGKQNECFSVPTLIAHIRDDLGYTTTYRKAWLAKQWAIEQVYENWEQSYNELPRLLLAMQTFIPGTIVNMQTQPALDQHGEPIPGHVTFHRLFWSFKACIDGFVFCKPLVQVDGT